MLITNIFSFSPNVFKRFIFQGGWRLWLFCKEFSTTFQLGSFWKKPRSIAIALASSLSDIVFVVQKLLHFVISPLLLKIFTWNSKYYYFHYLENNPNYQGRQSKIHFFSRNMPVLRLRLFILYQAPHIWVLAPLCGALVLLEYLTARYFRSPIIVNSRA